MSNFGDFMFGITEKKNNLGNMLSNFSAKSVSYLSNLSPDLEYRVLLIKKIKTFSIKIRVLISWITLNIPANEDSKSLNLPGE